MITSQCTICAHYTKEAECEAFPDGIPVEIITGRFDHTRPYAGDNGIRFVDAREQGGNDADKEFTDTKI